jgi:hypothetical protein
MRPPHSSVVVGSRGCESCEPWVTPKTLRSAAVVAILGMTLAPNPGRTLQAGSGAAVSNLQPASPQYSISNNWSGYVALNGHFTSVSGTFTVPHITRYLPGSTLSEWVGVDGYADSFLIQAGVNVIPAGPGQVLIEPWWEELPSPQQLAYGVLARMGDTVTVVLNRLRGDAWRIALMDNTNNDMFSTQLHYAGPLSSAEWIVEANNQVNGAATVLARFQPAINFSDLDLSDPQPTLTKLAMVQGSRVISSPSLLVQRRFTVTYGTVAPE